MKLSISEPLSDSSDILRQWDVTPEMIVVLLQNNNPPSTTLQARNWEGKKFWQSDVAEHEPWGLAIGGNFVFLGSEPGAIIEFDLFSGARSYVYSSHEDFSINLISTTYDPAGALLVIAGSRNGSIQVWDQASKTRRFHMTDIHTHSIFSFKIEDNILISTGGPLVVFWDLSTGGVLKIYTCEDARLYASVVINNKILATGGSGGQIWLFDRNTSELITTLSTNSRVLNGLMLYSPSILLSTDTSGQLILWSLETYSTINQIKVHEHSFLTCTTFNNILITGGKEGGGVDNICGLDCSLKSCNIEMLLQGKKEGPTEHGFPCRTLWKAQVVGERLVVCLFKRGKPHLDFWSLT